MSDQKLKFNDLKCGEHFICWPVPGDNSGHGGYLGATRLFVKTGDLTADSGNGSSSMHAKMTVIKIQLPCKCKTEQILGPSLTQQLVRELLSTHPLPWRCEADWTVEVTDANNQIVIKLFRLDDANELITFAAKLSALDRDERARINKFFGEPDPTP